LLAVGAVLIGACSWGAQAQPTDWSRQSSASGGGGLQELVRAAKREGLLALPVPSTDLDRSLIAAFESEYGVQAVGVAENDDAGQLNDTSLDVYRIAPDIAAAHLSRLAPYLVFYWLEIPSALKDAKSRWYQSCGGYVSLGYDSRKVPPVQRLDDLVRQDVDVAIPGPPTANDAGLAAVMAVSLADGGSVAEPAPALDFFRHLAASDHLVTAARGTQSASLGLDYTLPADTTRYTASPTVALYGTEAINPAARHPAAARLWEEFLFSDAGQNLCLRDGARPSRMDAIRADGVLDITAAADAGSWPAGVVIPTPAEFGGARSYVAKNWQTEVGCSPTC